MNCAIHEINLELEIHAPVSKVWDAMLNRISEWWPRDFLCLPDAPHMSFEPRAGGRLYEETADGKCVLWGHVTMILPENSIEIVGHMTPSYGGPNVTMTRMAIEPIESGTLFKLTNTTMGHIGPNTDESMREGWAYLFGAFKTFCE